MKYSTGQLSEGEKVRHDPDRHIPDIPETPLQQKQRGKPQKRHKSYHVRDRGQQNTAPQRRVGTETPQNHGNGGAGQGGKDKIDHYRYGNNRTDPVIIKPEDHNHGNNRCP